MTHFIFCHGFGFDPHFWERIEPYFAQEQCSFIDLGYFNKRTDSQCLHNQAIIGIGHSLGLAKLISMYHNFACLIGINSFINFLGTDQTMSQTRQRELNALRSGFLRSPEFTLRSFYLRCGAPELIACNDFTTLDLALILSDLQWLQQERNLPEVPTLILSSNDDIVVPSAITTDNFSRQSWVQQDSIMNAGHALGFIKPVEVYDKIMSFIDDRTTKANSSTL